MQRRHRGDRVGPSVVGDGIARVHGLQNALAGELGLSTRQLERRFRTHVGLGPKLFARLTRFQHAWRTAGCASSLAALAARAGYFDQAHLVRDFQEFAGIAPGAYAPHSATRPNHLPLVQDGHR